MEWLEISAISVELAKEEALVHLGVHESDAEFEVVSIGKIGLFGRVKENARVRARVLPVPVRPKESDRRARNNPAQRGSRRSSSRRSASNTPKPAAEPPAKGSARSSTKSDRDIVKNRKEKASMIEETTLGPSLAEQADIAEDFVRGIGETLGLSLTFTRHELQDGVQRIEVNGEGIGLLVGHRGVTARAIDDLTRTVLQRAGGTIREGKIRMDIAGIRARRAAHLSDFTERLAADVVESGEELALEPMNRADRRIVHDAVSRIEGVESRSDGEEPDRRVVIVPQSER